MRHGHVMGSKREKKGASDWYREAEEENIRKIEREARDTEDRKQARVQQALRTIREEV